MTFETICFVVLLHPLSHYTDVCTSTGVSTHTDAASLQLTLNSR